MQKLPKSLNEHPELARLTAYLTDGAAPILPDGRARFVARPFDKALAEGLKAAYGTGHLLQGLELIEKHLDREEHGLALVRKKTGAGETARISRILVIANDGTDRFYHNADSLLARHAARTVGLRVDASGADLGRSLTPKGHAAKALLVADKDALALMLVRWSEIRS